MLKKTFKICMTAFALMTAVMTNLFAAPLDYISSGEYAYFLDKRYSNEYERGYLVLHENESSATVIFNVTETKTGKNWVFSAYYEDTDEGYPTVTNISKLPSMPKKMKDEITQSIVDILNFDICYSKYRYRREHEFIHYEVTKSSQGLEFECSRFYPFFSFNRITDLEKSEVFVAKSFGMVKDNYDEFFGRKLMNFTPKNRDALLVIPKKEETGIEVDGIPFIIDANWKKNSDNNGYWLAIETDRDAQFLVEHMDQEVNDSHIKLILKLFLNMYPNIDPTTIKVRNPGKQYQIEYIIYDDKNQPTFTRLYFMKDKIVNFSAFKDIYDMNTDYFKHVLSKFDERKK